MTRLRTLFQRYGIELTALLVVTIWGVSFPFRKAALAEFDVLPFSALRFLGMLALAWGVWGWHHHRTGDRCRIARADLPYLVLSGICGYTLYLLLGFVGLSYTTAFSNTLLLATAPGFAALLLRGLRLEPIRHTQALGMGLSLLGVGVFVGEKVLTGSQTAGLGDLISLTTAAAFAVYTVVNKRLVARYAVPVVMTYTMTVGAIPALMLSLPTLATQDWSRITLLGWGALAWTVVVGVYLAWALWNRVIARLGVARAAVFMYLIPIIGGIASWLLLSEDFGILKIAGALLTLSGLACARHVGTPRTTGVPEEDAQRDAVHHTATLIRGQALPAQPALR